MNQEDIDKKYEDLKVKYWKPEWDNMEEKERFKDVQYTTYLHEIIVTGLEAAKEKRKECTEPLHIELIDVAINGYEEIFKSFKPVRRNDDVGDETK